MKMRTIFVGSIAAVAAFSFIKFALDSTEPDHSQPAEPAPANQVAPMAGDSAAEAAPDLSEIYNYAKDAVREKLKAPSTAKFSEPGWNKEAKVVPYGYHQWLCSGWVDSQNSFGANLRATWGAYVFRSDVAVRVDYIELGDTTYGDLPGRIPFPRHKQKSAP